MNGGCVVVGIPHPSLSFIEPHSTVYKTDPATWKYLLMDEILANEKLVFARWRGWSFIPSCESICVSFWRIPNALIQPVKFPFISRVVTKRGLELIASTLVLHYKRKSARIWTIWGPPLQYHKDKKGVEFLCFINKMV